MSNMREDFEAAISSLDGEDATEETTVASSDEQQVSDPASAEGTEAAADSGEGVTGEEGEKEGAPADEQLSSAEAADGAPSTPTDDKSGGEDAESERPPTDNLKAPAGWTPAEREQWSKVPRQLQERIHAREREMADSMANTKQARQTHEYFGQVANQFGSVLAADGFRNPLEAAQAAFGTMAALRMGTAEQKAQEVARLVSQYGVDINALDHALAGSAPQGGQQQGGGLDPAISAALEEKLGPVNQFMQTVQQLQQQQVHGQREQATQAVQKFAEKAEFLADVREDMADIIDLAAKRGVDMTLEQAYHRACAAHPEISQIIAQRQEQQRIQQGRQQLDVKRAAASSINAPQTGAPSSDPGNMSLRESIAAAFEQAAEG